MAESKIYKVGNKTFEILFWSKEDAEAFLSSRSGTTGLSVQTVDVFGRPNLVAGNKWTKVEEIKKEKESLLTEKEILDMKFALRSIWATLGLYSAKDDGHTAYDAMEQFRPLLHMLFPYDISKTKTAFPTEKKRNWYDGLAHIKCEDVLPNPNCYCPRCMVAKDEIKENEQNLKE